jgi:hypothetical protein
MLDIVQDLQFQAPKSLQHLLQGIVFLYLDLPYRWRLAPTHQERAHEVGCLPGVSRHGACRVIVIRPPAVHWRTAGSHSERSATGLTR